MDLRKYELIDFKSKYLRICSSLISTVITLGHATIAMLTPICIIWCGSRKDHSIFYVLFPMHSHTAAGVVFSKGKPNYVIPLHPWKFLNGFSSFLRPTSKALTGLAQPFMMSLEAESKCPQNLPFTSHREMEAVSHFLNSGKLYDCCDL